MKTTLLIDGDLLLYRTACAVENEVNWYDDLWTLHSDVGIVKDAFQSALEALKKRLKADDCVVCVSDRRNFRFKVYPDYKSQRKDTRKPLALYETRQWAVDHLGAIIKPGLEADDVLGILATKPGVPERRIVVSEDKDLLQIPGELFRAGKLITVSQEDADLHHMAQALAGDITDGYPGCPGWGIDRAETVVRTKTKLVPYQHEFKRGPRKGEFETRYAEEPADSVWQAVVSRYEAAGLTEADALVMARVSRICRWQDWDHKKQEVKLWTPPS